jgi:hypothetical protein
MKLGLSIKPQEGTPILPSGQYTAQMFSCEKKDSKAGGTYRDKDGNMVSKGYLECRFEIDAPGTAQHGWKIIDRLNLWHENTTTREIAERTIARMASAMGWADPITETEQLLNKRVILMIIHEESDSYGKQARIQKYMKLDDAGNPPIQEQKEKVEEPKKDDSKLETPIKDEIPF